MFCNLIASLVSYNFLSSLINIRLMEPQGEQKLSPNETWEEIRELDDFENWRDRNTIITKQEHKKNLNFISHLVGEFVVDILESIFKLEEEGIQSETRDVSENTTLPNLNPLDFDNIFVDTDTGQQYNGFVTENNIPIVPNDNDFKPASNFDFELSYFEQFNSGENIDYIPRDSLFRNFDPLASQVPCEKLNPEVPTEPPEPTHIPETTNFLQEEMIGECASSDSESSGNKENSFFSCSTKFPEELQTDGVTSGEDYESTNEDYFGNIPSDVNISPPSKNVNNNNNNNGRDTSEQNCFTGDYIDVSVNSRLPTDEAQASYHIEDEEFRPSHEVDLALEYLEDLDIGGHNPNLPRESLYTRFDPLTQQSIQPSLVMRRGSQLSNPGSSDIATKNVKNANLLTFSTPPKQQQQQTPRIPKSKSKHLEPGINNTESLYLDKPANELSSMSELRYTACEVRREMERARLEVRSKVTLTDSDRNGLIAIAKAQLTEMIENQRKKCNYEMKFKEEELHQLREEEELSVAVVMKDRGWIEGVHQAVQANIGVLIETKNSLMEESLEGHKTVENFAERMKGVEEDTGRYGARKSRVVSDLDDMTTSLTNFQTKITEATESIEHNLDRIHSLVDKIRQAAKTAVESQNRYFKLEDKAITKLNNANTLRTDYEREYNQRMVVLKTELRTKKMGLSEIQLEIKTLETKNEHLQSIAKEMMERHQQ